MRLLDELSKTWIFYCPVFLSGTSNHNKKKAGTTVGRTLKTARQSQKRGTTVGRTSIGKEANVHGTNDAGNTDEP